MGAEVFTPPPSPAPLRPATAVPTVPAAAPGFTLLEVMLAVALLGGLLVTVLYTLNYHLGVVQRHKTLTIATMLAVDKIEEMKKSPVASEGNFPPPNSGYSFVTGIGKSPMPGVTEIFVTVTKDSEDVTMTRLILK